MRFAFACAEYPTAANATLGGGIGTLMRDAARWLVSRGHEVHVVVSGGDAGPAPAGNPADRSVRLHPCGLPPADAKDPASVMAYGCAVAHRLDALHARAPLDVVLVAEWAAEGCAYRPSPGTLLVVTLQTPSHVVAELEYARHTADEAAVSTLEQRTAQRANLLLCPSWLLGRRLAAEWQLDPGRMLRLPNPIALPATAAPDLAAHDRGALPVLCVNRLTPLKAPDVLVRAAAHVHRQANGVRFRLVGRAGDWDGTPADRHLRALATSLGLAPDRLELAGARAREALAGERAAAAVCVNPSRFESYGYTSAEALAAGRATIVTDRQGIAEHLIAGEECVVVPAGDEHALADAMLALLRDPARAARLGDAGQRAIRDRLSCDAVLPAFERACASARSARARPVSV